MGTTPAFAATVLVGTALAPATADTGLGPVQPTHLTTLVTAGASGSRIDVIRYVLIGTTAAVGVLNLWRQAAGAGNYFLIDQVTVPITTPSSTVPTFEQITNYDSSGENMLLLGAGDVLAISVMAAALQSLVMVTAIGGSF